MSSFQRNLEKYADLTIKVGNNLQPGQRLLILGRWLNRGVPTELAPFVRELTRAAYRAGAEFVDVIWADQEIDRIRFEMAPDGSFDEYPQWFVAALHEYLERGDPTLIINAEDPQLMSEQDPEKVATAMQTAYENIESALNFVASNAVNWTVISAPVQGWADLVFPEVPEEKRIPRLWDQIFETLLINEDDPIAIWEQRLEKLNNICEHLNQRAYSALEYKGPGTDLSVGLPEGHIWHGGKTESMAGIEFAANLPTEEVFTLPHRKRVEGTVRATRPLSHSGNLIEDFNIKFEAGQVVSYEAGRGEHILQNILETDEGAKRLGEVALVPVSSSIAQSGILFYNVGYDENAASHLALGSAYKFTIEDGASMTDEDFEAKGGNISRVHVDFMIGSEELDIDGVTQNGAREAVMREGEWAFDVD